MLPPFDRHGNLLPGINNTSWAEVVARFSSTNRRVVLPRGLYEALIGLASAGCTRAYIDGSFVTKKLEPGDFDVCWSVEEVDQFELAAASDEVFAH